MARRQHDAYYTEQGLTLELLKYLDLSKYKTALEPCVGDGYIRDVVQALHPHLRYTTNDIDPTKQADFHYDASTEALYHFDFENCLTHHPLKWDCCITNFPYNQQDQIVPLVWQHIDLLAFLCRVTWLEPTRTRANFLQENAHHCRLQVIFNPRPRFDPKGTDSATSMWLVYDKSYKGNPQQIYATDWRQNVL